jgi:hypothetical protein
MPATLNSHSRISSQVSCFLEKLLTSADAVVEIYRIVSSKALDQGEQGQGAPGSGVKIDMTPSGTPDQKGNKCC